MGEPMICVALLPGKQTTSSQIQKKYQRGTNEMSSYFCTMKKIMGESMISIFMFIAMESGSDL